MTSKLLQARKDAKTVRRYFDEQTKWEAVEALIAGTKSRTEICEDLGIQSSQLLAWMGTYGERKRAYAEVERASAEHEVAASLGSVLAGALSGNLTAKLPADARGAMQDEVAKAIGYALLKALAESK